MARFTVQQLIFPLIIHLNMTITVFLEFIFSSKHPSVKRRVIQFKSYTGRGYDIQFAPYTM
ncbi:hypothetical protein SISSUDRAFT_1055427 [Sistotremastrum suecicum HHB10207 ss-3]|uniref:Uncharacterized protein n=1 Tax=Sistotremastrum suecicum HHB10207 ss-3 TaxID=1314776 RepID=A0A165XT11_9AGAM|nr:hypothetical protein SISSUDRAFT_1055427 [Sistotremastrum suecicum HHB10207 ss-3]